MAITGSGLGTAWSTAAAQFLTALVTDDYSNRLNDARNNAAAALGIIPTTSDVVAGKYIVEPVMFGRNGEAFGFVREGGKLPDPKTTNALTYAYRTRDLFARMLIDGKLLRATNKDDVSFIGVVERDFQAMSDDMAVDQNRILNQSEGSGRIAEYVSIFAANQAQIVIRLNSNLESVATCSTSPAQHLYVGQRLAFMSPAGVHRGTRTIVSIDSETLGPPSSAVVTFNSNITGLLTAGDWITKINVDSPADGAGPELSTSFRAEPMGFPGIFSDDGVLDGHGVASIPSGALSYVGTDDYTTTTPLNFQGIPVSNSFNKGIVMTGSGVLRPVTEALLQLSASKIEKQNNGKIDFMLSNYGCRDAYGIPLLGQKTYQNTTELRGGWSVLDWNGKPWYVDRHCLENRIYLMGLEGAGFVQHVNTTFQPLDPFGPQWYRLQDDDKYQAAWVMGYNLGVGIRERTGGVLTDLISVVST